MSWALFLSTAQEVHVSDKQKDLVAKICGKIAPSSGPEGTFKNLQQLQNYATKHEEFTALPSAELPGLKFEEPNRKRRPAPICGLMQQLASSQSNVSAP